MKDLQVAQLKANFSSVMDEVKKGAEFTICFGQQSRKVAVLIPYQTYRKQKRTLGLLEGRAALKVSRDFRLSDETLLSS